jgi:selenocysteine-specific elongation factor
VLFLDKQILFPGESCLVQFRLGEKVTSAPFDRYIVRSLSPIATIGGGIILEATLKKYRESDCDLLEYLHLLEKGVSEELVEKLIENSGYCALGLKDIAQRVGAREEEVRRVIDKLLQTGKAVDIGHKKVIHFKWYKNLREEIINRITEFHHKNPLERNISQEELKSRIGNNLNDKLYAFVIDSLIQHKKIVVENGRIMIQGHEIRLHLNPLQKRLADTLEQICKEAGLTPLSLYEMQERFKGYSGNEFNDVVKALISERVLIKLSESRIMHEESLKDIKHRVKDYITHNGKITLQEYKKLFSVGRLAAQLVLEYLDEIKFTLRIGDERRLHK